MNSIILCCTGAVVPLTLRVLAVFMALSIPILALTLNDITLYTWHPIFMALGFLGLMTEGVLTSMSWHTLEGSARTAVLFRHMWWQIGSVGCVSLGLAAIETNKVSG